MRTVCGINWGQVHFDSYDYGGYDWSFPILLDLDGNCVKVTELSQSTTYLDSTDDGLSHRTAWAGAGDGVLFYDVGGDNKITEKREYVFTEWDPTATDDMAALRAAFDANGDGKLTAADAAFASFKVMVTNADGTQTAQTLTALGITEIRLTQDATNIVLPDGSVITGQSTFLRSNGTTGTVANTTLATESMGYKITSNQTIAAGTVTIDIKAFDATGALDHAEKSVTNATGSTRTVSYDNDGNSVWDSLQTTVKTTNAASEQVTTITNQSGGVDIAAVVMNSMLWPCTYQTKV